jgi:hypothetical protein
VTTDSAAPHEGQLRSRRDIGKLVADGIRVWGISFGLLVLLTCAAFSAGTASDAGGFLAILGTALALAATAGLLGGFFGLLFGMPREADRGTAATTRARYTGNSNLLKVSDWVTTTIVGLSLVSLGSVPGAVDRFSTWIAPALGSQAVSGPFGVFVSAACFASVFLLLYLWTTVPLRSHLENEALDTEHEWSLVMAKVAERKPATEISDSLQSVSPAVLRLIESDTDRTPPQLRDLAARELARRGPTSAP